MADLREMAAAAHAEERRRKVAEHEARQQAAWKRQYEGAIKALHGLGLGEKIPDEGAFEWAGPSELEFVIDGLTFRYTGHGTYGRGLHLFVDHCPRCDIPRSAEVLTLAGLGETLEAISQATGKDRDRITHHICLKDVEETPEQRLAAAIRDLVVPYIDGN